MSVNPLPESAPVGIVGAGITGLALTRELGDAVVTLESTDEVGGVIRTREIEERVLDLGPQRTRLAGPVRETITDLGLTEELIVAPEDLPLYVFHDNHLRPAPLSPRTAVQTDLLSVRGKLRTLLEPLTAPPRPGESVGAFFRRTLGREAANRVAAPLYAGLYGSDPDEMPVEQSLGRALEKAGIGRSLLVSGAIKLLSMRINGRERPPAVTFEKGMATLPQAIHRAHEEQIHTSTPVERLSREGERFRLETPRGAVTVGEVVLTTPAVVTADLIAGIAPDTADRLRRLSYNPLAVVHLDASPQQEGVGFVVAPGAGTPLLGSTWNGAAFDRDGVVTCYLGGSDRPDLLGESDDVLGRLVASEFEEITGSCAHPIAVHRWHRGMPSYDDSWTALEGLELPDGLHLCANFHERAGIPGRFRAARATAETIQREILAAESSP